MHRRWFMWLSQIAAILFCYGMVDIQAQTGERGKIYLISDCQQPMKIETLHLKPYRNEEARDSLFSDILRQKPSNLFFLGDLTSAGSNKNSWNPIDSFLEKLKLQNTCVFAIPGNHEYFTCSKKGISNFHQRFPKKSLLGYCMTIDSMAMVLLNSNFTKLTKVQRAQQQKWYETTMDSLDAAPGVKVTIVCLHHAPYTNSTIVQPSKPVTDFVVPRFIQSPKARLFMSGHSHNLEYFQTFPGKYFLVVGGGGGLTQPLRSAEKRLFNDLLPAETKPLYFYATLERKGNFLYLQVRGIKKDFNIFYSLDIGKIDLVTKKR